MIDNNVRKVNELLAKALAYCAIALVILLLLIPAGIFNFSPVIVKIIIFAGIPATLFPIILFKIGIPDRILKHYMLIALGLVIGLLGTQNGIGIYMTYILVPLASCLYISKRFTMYIATFCYFVMAAALYVNCQGKMEVIYKGWSHYITYRNYLIGFTIEYIVVMLFVVSLVKRAQEFLTAQENNLRLQKQENDKQKRIADFYVNALTGQRTTVFNAISNEMDSFTTEDFVKMAAGHRFTTTLQEMLQSVDKDSSVMNRALESIGDYFDLDRILYVEPELDIGSPNRLSYHWARKEKYKLRAFKNQFSQSDYQVISTEYDKNGYIQLIPDDDDSKIILDRIECDFTRYIESIAIGAQVWIPAMSGGMYKGAMCFERMGNKPFAPVDILLLSDIVTSISMYVMGVNAERANKAKSAFLSSMSHEIRTPMNAILGMTTVALREEMNDEVRKSLNVIRSSSEGLLAIINDILDFSKIESGRVEVIPEEYSVLALMNDVKTIVEARNVEKGLDLIFNIPDDLPSKLYGDMVRIKQVCVNLATNAIKYTDNGSVTLSISCEQKGDENVQLRYSVKDTGQGIRNEDKAKLFTSFTQVNQEANHHTEGTGLGLAISKQLVELMGGTIEVESVFGQGSTFSFAIPQKVVDATPAGKLDEFEYENKAEADDEMFTAPDAHILVVDDNDINRMVAESLLSVFEMDISLAAGGLEAIELCKLNKYDIIFMDHLMPDLDGIETTKKIRADESNPNHDTKIVALTADAMSGVKEQMLSAGMDDFLSKPIDLKLCMEILKKYL